MPVADVITVYCHCYRGTVAKNRSAMEMTASEQVAMVAQTRIKS